MQLVLYPDEHLRQKCTSVKRNELKHIRKWAKSMYLLMLENNGAALAAPQIGINKRFFVIKEGLMPFSQTLIVNPQWRPWGQREVVEEGCLSFPKLFLLVERFSKISVEYWDGRGKIYEGEQNDFAAQVFQHETEHLNGRLFTDVFKKIL